MADTHVTGCWRNRRVLHHVCREDDGLRLAARDRTQLRDWRRYRELRRCVQCKCEADGSLETPSGHHRLRPCKRRSPITVLHHRVLAPSRLPRKKSALLHSRSDFRRLRWS